MGLFLKTIFPKLLKTRGNLLCNYIVYIWHRILFRNVRVLALALFSHHFTLQKSPAIQNAISFV